MRLGVRSHQRRDTRGVVVRPAVHEDASSVAELLTQLGYPVDTEELEGRLAALGPNDLVLVAEDCVGVVALHRVPRIAEGGAFVRITALAVREGERGHGVGQALLEATEAAARRWGCDLIEVSSGRRPEREPAHRFYRAAGFTDTSERSARYHSGFPDRPLAVGSLLRE